VRRSQTGTRAACGGLHHKVISARLAKIECLLFLLAGLIAPSGLQAQTATAKDETKSPAVTTGTMPLGRFVPKENLVFYMEFAGFEAHADAWKNTAASKMLNETPLGEMLTEVSGQLLDKALEFFPNHKTSGAEIVTLVKNAARFGWVLAINVNPSGPGACRGTLVLRGAASKDLRPLSSRLMGWVMGEAKPKIESKDGRTMIVVPAPAATKSSSGLDPGWVWWAEKNDLVVGFLSPNAAAAITAAIDGKTPSAIEHPRVQELAKPEGKFQPICVAFAETGSCPENPAKFAVLLRRLSSEWGIERMDLRWGFDGDALMTVARLAAPKPRKPGLAIFDEPSFEKSSLLPMPDGVDSFVELSTSFSGLLETIKLIAPEGAVREQIDEMAESIRSVGSIDLQKDLLAYLGPKMVVYLAPGRSAASNDDSLESALSKGWSPTAAVAALQSVFPKLTVVAEVNNPEKFGKALDAAMIAINGELKAQAVEKAVEERKAEENKEGGGASRNLAGRQGAGGDRTKRRRSLQDTPAPRFTLSQSAPRVSATTPIPGEAKAFILMTPSGSPLRFGPTSFRPTVQLDGRHVAFSVSPDAARAALAAVQRKDWKPSADLERACENVPAKFSLLSFIQVSDSLSSLLASLPGTLQTMINTSIALAKGRATANTAAGGSGQASSPIAGPPGGPGGRGGRAGGAAMAGVPRSQSAGGAGRPGFGPGGGFGNNATDSGTTKGAGASGATTDSMVVLKVDTDKLPKSADLKAYLFPSTLSVSATDQEIRLVSRGAFPNLSLPIDLVPVAAVMPALQSILDRAKQAPAGEAGQAPVAGDAPGGAGSQTGGAGSPPAGKGGGTSAAPGARAPGSPGGRRGGRSAPPGS
jgi:hypothetical protein